MQENFGTPDSDRELRAVIAAALKRSPLKRSVICEKLTALVGIRVTENMLNDFTAPNRRAVRFPLLFSSALCEILDDDTIGLFGVRPRIRQLVQFAELQIAGSRHQRESAPQLIEPASAHPRRPRAARHLPGEPDPAPRRSAPPCPGSAPADRHPPPPSQAVRPAGLQSARFGDPRRSRPRAM